MTIAKLLQRLLKPIAFTSILIALTACGGGGGGGGSSSDDKPTYLITSPTLVPYNGSEILTYVVRGSGGYDDCSGQVTYDSDGTVYITGGIPLAFSPTPDSSKQQYRKGTGKALPQVATTSTMTQETMYKRLSNTKQLITLST